MVSNAPSAGTSVLRVLPPGTDRPYGQPANSRLAVGRPDEEAGPVAQVVERPSAPGKVAGANPARSIMRPFGPKKADHPSTGNQCPACNQPFLAGQFTTLVMLGPGDDLEAQERAREGRTYNAVAQEVHWTCATGTSMYFVKTCEECGGDIYIDDGKPYPKFEIGHDFSCPLTGD